MGMCQLMQLHSITRTWLHALSAVLKDHALFWLWSGPPGDQGKESA